jgi:putrescine---pyruvate transaminase
MDSAAHHVEQAVARLSTVCRWLRALHGAKLRAMAAIATEPSHPTYWHPFSAMPGAVAERVVLVRGHGCRVWDDAGRSYLDAMAGLWFCSVGHGRAELAQVAAKQMQNLAGYHTFGSMANRPALDLADRICSIAPMSGRSAAFLVNGGSDAVDTAAKMARRYWQVRGESQRTTIVSQASSYHGVNGFGTSLAGIEPNAHGWGEIVPAVERLPRHDVSALRCLLEAHGSRIAAFIAEPVIGAGGVYPPPEDFWSEVTELCRAHSVLVIADEVITGYGRLGPWFGSERYGIQPDLITSAKGLSSGYLPIGAVVAGPRILDTLWSDDAGALRHGYTYSGHPAACAVAIANLDIIDREGLRFRVQELEPILAAAVKQLEAHPLVRETRSVGLLAAVEIEPSVVTERPHITDDIASASRRRGILTRGLVGRALQLSPPFVISESEIDELIDRLALALDDVVSA